MQAYTVHDELMSDEETDGGKKVFVPENVKIINYISLAKLTE